jgi:Spy/CpxP family protein refolding chaperone
MQSRVSKVAVAIVGLVVVSSVLAGCRHRHDPDRVKKFVTWFVDDALDDLDASDAQREAIHASKSRLLADGFALRQEGRRARAAMLAEWEKSEPDADRVHALIDERVAAFQAYAHKAADEALAAHAVLTPEQRGEISERLHEHLEVVR